jgi:hypothetical protein
VHHLHEREVRPAAESRPGSLGLSLLASPEAGGAVLESFLASRDALAASEQAEALQCGELAWRARGSVTSERYQLSVFEREALLHGGEEVRLARIAVKPSTVADLIEVFGDSAVPWLAGNHWFPQRAASTSQLPALLALWDAAVASAWRRRDRYPG